MDIVTRAKNIILSPNTEWPVIAAEQTTVKDLYQGYIAPLMAIGPICSFLALLFFARGLGVGAGLVGMIVIYAINLAATYVVALLAQFLAPQFGGRADIVDALKLVAYSSTPAWVGGVFNLIPFPPLDGSRILRHFLPYNALAIYDRMGIFALWIFMLVAGGFIFRIFLSPLQSAFDSVLAAL